MSAPHRAPEMKLFTDLEAIPVSRADMATRETTPYSVEHLVAVNASRAAKRLSLAAGALLPRVRGSGAAGRGAGLAGSPAPVDVTTGPGPGPAPVLSVRPCPRAWRWTGLCGSRC